MPTRRALRGWTSLSRLSTHVWRSVVTCKHRSAAPVREVSSPPVPLPVVWLSPAGQDRLPYARWGAHVTNDPKRLPSWAAFAHFRVRSGFLGVAGKSNPWRTTHTVSPSLVPPCAFNATSTSLGLGYRALTRWPRCVRPTSAIHSLPETCTRALGFRPAWSRAG